MTVAAQTYPGTRNRRALVLIAGTALLIVAAAIWSIGVGAVAIPGDVIINTLFNLDGEKQTYIIMRSRLPRIVLAILCGGAFALSGTIIQAVIRNPLASPGIIGINAGAALFAVSLVTLFPAVPQVFMPVAACAGGLAAAAVVIITARTRAVSAAHLALIGVAVGFVCEAGVDYFLVTSSDAERSAPLIWLTGSLWGRTWSHVEIALLPLTAFGSIALLLAHRLDLMGLGAETATGLGIKVPRASAWCCSPWPRCWPASRWRWSVSWASSD